MPDLRLQRNKHINQQYLSRANGLTLLIFREHEGGGITEKVT